MARTGAETDADAHAVKEARGNPLIPLARFLADTASSLAGALIPFFVIVSLSPPILALGLIEGVGSLSKLLVEAVPEPLGGKKMRLRISSICYAIGAVISVLLFQAFSPVYAVLGRLFIRTGDDARSGIAIADNDCAEGKPMPVSPFIFESGHLGKIAGPFLLLLLLAYLQSIQPASSEMFQPIFSLALAFGVLSLLLMLLSRIFASRKEVKKSAEILLPAISLKPLLSSKETRAVFFVSMLLMLASFSPFFFIYRVYLASGLILAALGLLAFVIARHAFSPALALISSRIGGKKVLSSGAICLILALVLAITFPASTMIAILVLVLWGISLSMLYSAPLSFILSNTKKDESQSAIIAFVSASSAIGLPANIIAALLWGATIAGSPATFLFSLIVAILALALSVF